MELKFPQGLHAECCYTTGPSYMAAAPAALDNVEENQHEQA